MGRSRSSSLQRSRCPAHLNQMIKLRNKRVAARQKQPNKKGKGKNTQSKKKVYSRKTDDVSI
jgi:hypothetical protein